jgi:hypothetical protein
MSERMSITSDKFDRRETEQTSRFDRTIKLIKNEALIEAEPTLQFLNESSLSKDGGSLYYGTGLTTPRAISKGLPFDVLGMMLTAEKVRRTAGLETVYHHIADTHAKTNDWIDGQSVDEIATKTIDTLGQVSRGLGLDNFQFVLSSSFDTSESYTELVDSFDDSEEHEYVRREMADMEWYRSNADVRIKLGWIIQSKETVYAKPGRTFDTSRPKASPYISVEGEKRLLLSPDTNVKAVFDELNDPGLGGAKKHIESIVRLYESIYGSLGKVTPDNTLADKLQTIIDKCFSQ